MYCTHCFMKWANAATGHTAAGEPIPICPKCNKLMADTNYSQWNEERATETYDVDSAGQIYCIETGKRLTLKTSVAHKPIKDIKPFEQVLEEREKKEDEWLQKQFKKNGWSN